MGKNYFLSLDVETSGPFPGLFNLVSIGAVPIIREGLAWTILRDRTFYVELHPLPDAQELPATLKIHGLSVGSFGDVVRHASALFQRVKVPCRSGLQGPDSYPDAGDGPKGGRRSIRRHTEISDGLLNRIYKTETKGQSPR